MSELVQASDRMIARQISMARRQPWDGRDVIPAWTGWTVSAITEPGRPTGVRCTFDIGYASSGWWANAMYDRCLHISVSHIGDGTELVVHPETKALIRRQRIEAPSDAEVRAWACRFFGEYAGWAWIEPPARVGDTYRLPGIAHARLFYDPRTDEPCLPEGEVYSLVRIEGVTPPKVAEGRYGADVR